MSWPVRENGYGIRMTIDRGFPLTVDAGLRIQSMKVIERLLLLSLRT